MIDSEVFIATELMHKSVENLLISSHELIGSSISSSLTVGAMTLPNSSPRSPSPSASPQSSPRPSPRQQHKRDHSKSDIPVGSYKDSLQIKSSDVPDEIAIIYEQHHQEAVTSTLDQQLDTVEEFKTYSAFEYGLKKDSLSRSSDSGQIPDLNRSISQEAPNKERTKESRSSDRTKKKSSWYNVLYPTYKSRSEDFKRIFKDVPPEERLVVDYSCALQKDILVHGRLYVSQNYLCFYANIFRWETSVSLRWKDVTAITKEKTALVIPNAILVCTEGEKLFFTSFGARDKTYLMLFRVWQNALMDQQMSMQEMWQWVHTCYGDELGLTSDDEDYIPPVADDDKLSNISVRLSVDSFPEECFGMAETPGISESPSGMDDSMEQATIAVDSMSPETSCMAHSTQREERDMSSLNIPLSETLPTDMSDTTESDVEKVSPDEINKPVKCTSTHEGRRIIQFDIPLNIDQVFTMLFTNSKFFLDFHTARRTTDITQSPWMQLPDGLKQRKVNLTMALNQSVGPKSTQVTETQTMMPCSKPGELYGIDTESFNAGIPYADSFSVNSHYCLKRIADNETRLSIYSQIKYKKSVWGLVKSFIEKNTWSGLEDFYTSLQKALLEEGTQIPITKKKTRRRRRTVLGPCLDEEPMRRPAPREWSPIIEERSIADTLSWVVLGILLFLVFLNAVLYYKLWMLEEWAQDSSQSFTVMDLQVLRHPPKSHDEWLQLMQQQEMLHNIEMQKWQKVLQAAVQLLRETEESLTELQRNINPLARKKVLSVLKETLSGHHSGGGDSSSDPELEEHQHKVPDPEREL